MSIQVATRSVRAFLFLIYDLLFWIRMGPFLFIVLIWQICKNQVNFFYFQPWFQITRGWLISTAFPTTLNPRVTGQRPFWPSCPRVKTTFFFLCNVKAKMPFIVFDHFFPAADPSAAQRLINYQFCNLLFLSFFLVNWVIIGFLNFGQILSGVRNFRICI